MKSKFSGTLRQTIVGDNGASNTVGYILIDRRANVNNLVYDYSNGTTVQGGWGTNLFQNLDNQWIHIVVVCDYTNKTLKFYRNGIQFGTTQTLTGTPVFPSSNKVKYIGSYNATAFQLTDGSLDEVRIYNRGLSAEEVSSIYNATKSKYGF